MTTEYVKAYMEEELREICFNDCGEERDDCSPCDLCRDAKAYSVAIKALEKQIPTGEPKKSWEDARGYTDTFICEKCNSHVTMPIMSKHCDYSFCPFCGQKWSEEE